jgi:hypothetical protein
MGAGATALFGGLMKGYSEGVDAKQQEEYKKLLIQKSKDEIELASAKVSMMKNYQADPTNWSKAMMAGIPWESFVMYNAMRTSTAQPVDFAAPAPTPPTLPGLGQPGQAEGAPTFPGTLTGIPTLPDAETRYKMGTGQMPNQPQATLGTSVHIPGTNLTFGDVLQHKLGGITPANAGKASRDVPVQHPQTGQWGMAPMAETGAIMWDKWRPAREDVQWGPTEIPNVEAARTKEGKLTGQFRQTPPGYELKEQQLTDGTKVWVHVPKAPGQLGAAPGPLPVGRAAPAAPGTIKMEIDPSTLTAADVEGIAAQLKGMIPGAAQGATGMRASPGPLDSIPTEQDRIWYKNEKGETMPPGMTVRQGTLQGNFVRIPEKAWTFTDVSNFNSAVKASEDVPQVQAWLFPAGQLDPGRARSLAAWHKSPELFAGTEAAKYGKMLSGAAEARIRSVSGAAVPESEVVRERQLFMNQFLSTPEAIEYGLQSLQQRLSGTVNILDPSGYYRAQARKGSDKKSDMNLQPMLDAAKQYNWQGPGIYTIRGQDHYFANPKALMDFIGSVK